MFLKSIFVKMRTTKRKLFYCMGSSLNEQTEAITCLNFLDARGICCNKNMNYRSILRSKITSRINFLFELCVIIFYFLFISIFIRPTTYSTSLLILSRLYDVALIWSSLTSAGCAARLGVAHILILQPFYILSTHLYTHLLNRVTDSQGDWLTNWLTDWLTD